jgi:hypothetical protein
MYARIIGRKKTPVGHYRIENAAGRSAYSTTEVEGTPERTNPAPEHLLEKEIPKQARSSLYCRGVGGRLWFNCIVGAPG